MTSRQKFQKICLIYNADRKPTEASGRFDWPIEVTGATKAGREDCEEMGKVKGHWTVFNGLQYLASQILAIPPQLLQVSFSSPTYIENPYFGRINFGRIIFGLIAVISD